MSISSISGNAAYQARSGAGSQTCQQNQATKSASNSRSSPATDSVTIDFSTLAMLLQSAQSNGQSAGATSSTSQSMSATGRAGAVSMPPPPMGMRGGMNGTPPPFEEMDQALSDLSSALESGDIDAAKAAFETFQSLTPQLPPEAAGNTDTSTDGSSESTASTFSDKLAALSDALDSGDAEAAQSAYDTLMEDIESHKPDEGMQARQRQQSMDQYMQMAMIGSNWSSNNSTLSASA